MIGIVAAAAEIIIEEAPPGPPALTALGQFDFVNGTYSWGATSLSAGDVTDKTAWIGASGLAIPQSQSAGAQILYSAATALLAGCDFTLALEIEKLSTSAADILTVFDASDLCTIQVLVDGSYYELNDYDGAAAARYADDTVNGQTLAVHRLAVTSTQARASISVDGNTAITVSTSTTLPVGGSPMTKFYFGGTDSATYKAVNIRSISFYETQADSVLPSLSS